MTPTQPAPRGAWRGPAFAHVVLLVVVMGVLAAACRTAETGEHPLDPYPGFGRSPEAVARDEAIAYWEAYRREALVASCVRGSGFEYVPDVAFGGATLAVARTLGVEPLRGAVPPDPSELNRRHRAGLAPRDLARYDDVLHGTTGTDEEREDATGMDPPAPGEVGADGCVGRASREIGSVWDLQRAIGGELEEASRGLISSASMSATRAAYRRCGEEVGGLDASTPADVDAAFGTGGERAQAALAVFEACDAVWRTGYRAAEAELARAFVERHAAELAEAAKRYEGAIEAMRGDLHFLRYLGEAAGRLHAGAPVEPPPPRGGPVALPSPAPPGPSAEAPTPTDGAETVGPPPLTEMEVAVIKALAELGLEGWQAEFPYENAVISVPIDNSRYLLVNAERIERDQREFPIVRTRRSGDIDVELGAGTSGNPLYRFRCGDLRYYVMGTAPPPFAELDAVVDAFIRAIDCSPPDG